MNNNDLDLKIPRMLATAFARAIKNTIERQEDQSLKYPLHLEFENGTALAEANADIPEEVIAVLNRTATKGKAYVPRESNIVHFSVLVNVKDKNVQFMAGGNENLKSSDDFLKTTQPVKQLSDLTEIGRAIDYLEDDFGLSKDIMTEEFEKELGKMVYKLGF